MWHLFGWYQPWSCRSSSNSSAAQNSIHSGGCQRHYHIPWISLVIQFWQPSHHEWNSHHLQRTSHSRMCRSRLTWVPSLPPARFPIRSQKPPRMVQGLSLSSSSCRILMSATKLFDFEKTDVGMTESEMSESHRPNQWHSDRKKFPWNGRDFSNWRNKFPTSELCFLCQNVHHYSRRWNCLSDHLFDHMLHHKNSWVLRRTFSLGVWKIQRIDSFFGPFDFFSVANFCYISTKLIKLLRINCTRKTRMIHKWFTNYSQIILKLFSNHSQMIHKLFSNHSQMIHKLFSNHFDYIISIWFVICFMILEICKNTYVPMPACNPLLSRPFSWTRPRQWRNITVSSPRRML